MPSRDPPIAKLGVATGRVGISETHRRYPYSVTGCNYAIASSVTAAAMWWFVAGDGPRSSTQSRRQGHVRSALPKATPVASGEAELRREHSAQTAMIENGFVPVPEKAPWLAQYPNEMTVFPNGKHDDQVDATAQLFDWFKEAPAPVPAGDLRTLPATRRGAPLRAGAGHSGPPPGSARRPPYPAVFRHPPRRGRRRHEMTETDAAPQLQAGGRGSTSAACRNPQAAVLQDLCRKVIGAIEPGVRIGVLGIRARFLSADGGAQPSPGGPPPSPPPIVPTMIRPRPASTWRIRSASRCTNVLSMAGTGTRSWRG
jgi:hypothetical protein